jgi:hypothetical protein
LYFKTNTILLFVVMPQSQVLLSPVTTIIRKRSLMRRHK